MPRPFRPSARNCATIRPTRSGRTFLFELLCFAGEYDRAEKQLDILAQRGNEAELGALLYRAALHAERTRDELFRKNEYPRAAIGGTEPSAVSGTLNGAPFESLEDGDPRVGARLEVYAAGQYLWIPFEHMESIEMQAPKRLRDLIWAPALVRTGPSFKDKELGEVLIPVLAPETWRSTRGRHPAGPHDGLAGDRGRRVVPVGTRRCCWWTAKTSPFWNCAGSRSPRRGRRARAMPLRNDILTPIPGDNPSGANLRYAPIYDKIKEARREEEDIVQGDWARERKVADWPLAIKLISEALATKSKDLQLAAWLTEALLRKEGITGLKEGLDLMRSLIEQFWDTLYPEIEDGDAEFRATPLQWVGDRLEKAVKNSPLTRNKLDWFQYKESRTIGYEEDASTEEKRSAREQAIAENKITAELFDAGFNGHSQSVLRRVGSHPRYDAGIARSPGRSFATRSSATSAPISASCAAYWKRCGSPSTSC